ncbi:MAG: FAD-dependent oxidoreductase [Dehalococcoidia bacterium]
METITTDVLVIGAGGAAARAAVEAAGLGVKVTLVDKGRFGESGSSPPSLGGFATSFNPEDTPESFFEDWIRTGGRINDQNLVWEAITQSIGAAEGLEAMGMEFIRHPDGQRNLYRGAGQSLARNLTAKHHEAEGPNVVIVLREEAHRRGVQVLEGIMITKLLKRGAQVVGAMGLSSKREPYVFSAGAVVLAAGGANRIYPNVAAPLVDPKYRTTGDGFALAFDAGAPLIDMEFIQFRDSPPGGSRYGGRYLNSQGERFMERYDPERLEKAPRCKMAEALYTEIQAGRGPIMWEVGGINPTEMQMSLARSFADQKMVEIILDFQRILGGVRINERAETALPGLFAAGESSGGVQGGDRMQGNAFLETQVFGANAGRNAAVLAKNVPPVEKDPAQVEAEEARIRGIGGSESPAQLIERVQQIMWEQVGVVRNGPGLREALAKFEELGREKVPQLSDDDIFAALEAANLLRTAEMVSRAALTREETRASHIRSDYPATDDGNWLKHVCLSNRGGEMAISTLPIITR